jgi:GT2 family glycosyltransferase/Flp pilus assembly protein TadD
VERELQDLLRRERPEIFFYMHCTDEVSSNLASFIRDETAALSVVFFSDDDWRLQDSLAIAGRYHVIVTTCEEAVDAYRARGITDVVYAPYACNPALYHPLEGRAKDYDVTFVGQAYRGRPELVEWLKAQGIRVRVWGQGWEEHPGLRDMAGGFLPHHAMLEVFAKSKIVLGMSWVSGDGVTLQIKGRTFEYAACRAFQLTTYDPRLKALFQEGEEIVFYRDRQDLADKIRHYLAHDGEREAIAQRAYERALTSHTWTRRLQDVLAEAARLRARRSHQAGPLRTASRIPTVAVLTYVYNGARYIDELIRSVLAQSFTDFEFFILDDGSTDDTNTIVERYLHDPRIRYVYQENIGRNLDAFHELINRCVAMTTAPYVCFAGADDVFLPEKLSVQVAALQDDPDVAIVFSDAYHIDAEGRTLPSDFRFAESRSFTPRSLLRTLFKKNIVPHPTVMMRRQTIQELGGFEDGYTTDPHFWLKAAPHVRFRYIDQKLVQYRIHEGGSSTSSHNRTVPETVGLLTRMRNQYTILDLYPELEECRDRERALYSAYLHFGNLLCTANIPVPAVAIGDYARALDHRPGGVEAMNNAAVLLWLLGAQEKSLPLFAALQDRYAGEPAVAHNLALLRHLQVGHDRADHGFVLLREAPAASELLRWLDQPHDDTADRLHGGWPLAGIRTSGVTPSEAARPASAASAERAQMSSSAGERPLVSVIIPTFNRPQQLQRAVESVLSQTYANVEVIVVNDAGDDVAGMLAAMPHPEKIVYVRHGENRERAAARNTGLKLARGKYIAYLDDDDRFLPDHLQTLVEFLETQDYRVAYSDAWRVHEERRGDAYVETKRDVPYSYEFDATRLLISNYVPVLSVVHARACLDDVGLFDEALTSHEDWDLWIRLSRRFPFAHIKQVTAEFTWRTDGSSTTSRNQADFVRTAAIIFEKYRAVSEPIPGLLELQARALQELQACSQTSFTCSIIIPVCNKAELTRQCLIQLAATTTDVSYELIVVDNASTDGTTELLNGLKGDVQVIRNDRNLGFAKACNQGARAARGTYVVFLNNDTVPLTNWLKPLVSEVEEHPEVGVVGSKLLFADGTVQHAGVVFQRSQLCPYHIYRRQPSDLPAVNQRREFQVVTGACMLVRKDLFDAVGMFDEGYRNGFEDVDLCLKIRDKGHHIVYQPRSVLYHLESQTPGRKEHEAHNMQRLRERWATHWWLADEDLHYHTDGYKLLGKEDNGGFVGNLQLLSDIKDRAAWAHVAATQAAALRQDWAAVRRELRLVEDWPADAMILLWAAGVAQHLEETLLHTTFLKRYLEQREAPAIRLALARATLERNEVVEADTHLRKLLACDPHHAEGLLLQGILCMQREQYREAEAAFTKALDRGADRKKCLMGAGMACMGRKYLQGAWQNFLRVLSENPDDAEAIHWLLRAGTAQNRWIDLSRQLRNYLTRNPGDLAARFAFASVLLRADLVEEAQQEYSQLRALAPSYDGLVELGQALASKEASMAVEPSHS